MRKGSDTRANKHLLLWASVGTLLLLGWAAFDENYRQEWRLLQARYRDRLPAERRAEFSVQLRQVVVPSLDAADRCVTCHVGMAPGETAIPGDKVFGPHPNVVHDTAAFGCTICHGGQGRATLKADAHGTVAHWPEPMIPRKYAYAGCGSCHTHLAVPDVASLERGRARFERYDCLACHRMEGRGGTLRPGAGGGMEGPDLSAAGARGYDRSWYAGHLARSEQERAAASAPGPWASSFGEVAAEDLPAIDVYLSSRVGSPGLVEAKATFHSMGCRGCHSIGGVGGDDGPDLTSEGRRDPGRLSFAGVRSGGGLSDWLKDHFKAPARVVSGSAMPEISPTDAQIEQLTYYMLSLRRADQAAAYWPKDRILAERFNEREFATDGQALYGTYCAACHGPRGEGMRFPGATAFPAIANPDFLSIASDDFLRATVRQGRPGRRMPAWGEKEGGLRPREVDAVVAHVRRLGGGVAARPDTRPSRWARGDAAAGARLYADACASCHGPAGEGGEGPALHNRVLLKAATDTYLFETVRAGRTGTSMPAFSSPSPARRTLEDADIEAIVTHIRSWEVEKEVQP
jgi:cbb3-type cytochrome c oxidase subunit III